ncbi:MAG TPA: hypothetical protein VH112_06560 [Acidimicrobiales bacterium]|jgi:hypothetical protein|nr:hypothetical protein [Acidimicrobiales bacterium]
MGIRTWMLRRAMGRLRITDDIVRYLSTFQRLGETVEVEMPGELLPVGARTVFRAVRTRAAAQLAMDWVWPWWLERQLDPRSPAFVPRGHLPLLTNVTGRAWTMVGNPGSSRKGIVDPRGLVTPWYDGWSLDWWVESEDGWHLPSRDGATHQRLVDGTPVVETTVVVPGGRAAHRVYAVMTGARDAVSGTELLVVELENRSRHPLVVALAVRPYNPEGLAVVERIALEDRTVMVDGRPALLLPRPPSAVAGSTFAGGDSATTVLHGGAGPQRNLSLRCEVGLAQLALVLPLAPEATHRVALPLVAERRTRRRRLARRRAERVPELPATLPSSAATARDWRTRTDRGTDLVLPRGRLADAVDACRRFLVLSHEGTDVMPGPFTYHRFWFRDAAYLLAALNRYGFHAEAAEVLASYPDRQGHDGFFFSQRQEWDANGAALWSLAEHWRLSRDDELVARLAPTIARAAAWIEHKRHTKPRSRRSDPALEGLMPAGVSAEHLGPFDYFFWDDFWSLRGLVDAAPLLRVAGDEAAAARADEWAAGMRADLWASMERTSRHLGTLVIPAGPHRRVDPGIIGSLVACHPLGLIRPHDPAMAATVEAVRERFLIGSAFFHGISHTGLGTYLTLQLAFVELAAGDRRALDRLEWLVGAASSTFTWPEAIHPLLGDGCMGDGHHGWATADFLSFVRELLVRETADGLALCTMLPEEWCGRPLAVHGAPTHRGSLSFQLGWEAGRAVLRWELQAHPGAGSVRLTAPGLDPSWSSVEPRGEVELAIGALARSGGWPR